MTLEDARASLWFMPSVAAVVSLLAALALAEVAPEQGPLADLPWPGDANAASTVLQVIATTTIPVTSLTFSLVVVALQLASQQFSPRLLREFARDRVIQGVLSVLVATFVFSLTVLLGLASDEPVPRVAVVVAFLLSLLSIGALLAFLGHLVKALRVDTMMVSVHRETAATIEQAYPPLDDDDEVSGLDDVPGPGDGTLLLSPRSGFVKLLEPAQVLELAEAEDVVLWLAVRPGDHVVVGTPLATACASDGSAVPAAVRERLAREVLRGITLGYERTSEQDAALGLRQLTDIAVKALSPGINDPVTAAHAVGYAADLLVRLHGRRLGPQVKRDAAGRPRTVLPDRDHVYYLDLVCGPVRRYGRREPSVLVALLRMLRDVALSTRGWQQRDEVREQARRVVAEMADDLLREDAEQVRDMAARVEQALDGEVGEAYADRAGETRSV